MEWERSHRDGVVSIKRWCHFVIALKCQTSNKGNSCLHTRCVFCLRLSLCRTDGLSEERRGLGGVKRFDQPAVFALLLLH